VFWLEHQIIIFD